MLRLHENSHGFSSNFLIAIPSESTLIGFYHWKKGETAVPVVFFAKDVVCFYFSGVWIVWVYTLSLEKKGMYQKK